ncbi:serine hydrolase domain-containing protein [Allopontixanthobacter sp.]|uniref:serine hydrolase domain-containing protein n=1 Tax=Allopontixanthobacter sp. TaxID=2906452 RepID=UPI002ABBEB1C|nr:serine hydrolase domain-containing protein [Allopontixanthobacter sp.]MDZ4307929.1 serine hydrolase domain-containing protein [Allopontixanthobacter sp.]
MAYREFEDIAFSRRSLLRGGAWLGAGAALAGLPMGAAVFAQDGATSASWTNVAAMVNKYGGGTLANMVAAMGWGQQSPEIIARGTLAVGQAAPAGIDSLYRIYSMTKPITGMAVMMLIDQGKLGLDQPLAEILPAYAKMQVQRTPDGSITDTVPAERPITIRHLLTHTAGLGYNVVQKGAIKTAYEDRGLIAGQVSRLPIPGFGRGKPVESLEAFADGLAALPLVYQPGTKWSYSVSLDLLGRVIEVVSGTPFDEFLAANIFKPCGMTSTWFQVPESEIGRLTANYGVMGGALLPIDPANASIYTQAPAFPFGGAGLVSSPRDYDRFLRMLLGYGTIDGTRVMGELAVRVGTSNLLPETVGTAGTMADGAGFGAGGRVGLGAQAGTYGWGGAAGTVAYVSMKLGLRASLYTQYMPSEAFPVHGAFPTAVLADLAAMQG